MHIAKKKLFFYFFTIFFAVCAAVFVCFIKQNNITDYSNSLSVEAYGYDYYKEGYLQANLNSKDAFILDNEIFVFAGSSYKQLTNDGYAKSHLNLSPGRTKLGYFIFYNYSNNKEIIDVDYDEFTALRIVSIDGTDGKDVYIGDFKTANWEWLNNNEVVVYRGCGTECRIAYVVDINTGEKKSKLLYGVGYKWSPDKTKALTFRYYLPGIVVGDKYGNELFVFKRERSAKYSKLSNIMQAEWSNNSNKIALVIKKDNEDKLELLIFDAQNNFKQIFETDIDTQEDVEIYWGTNNKVFINSLEYIF